MIKFFRVDQPDNKAYITPPLEDGRVGLSDDGETLTLLDGTNTIAIFKPSEWLSVFGSADREISK